MPGIRSAHPALGSVAKATKEERLSRIPSRAVALAAVTAASFAVASPAAAATAPAEKRQNTAIKKSAAAAKTAGSTARKARLAARRADRKAAAAASSATTAINEAKKANDGVGTVNTVVVPAALKALTDLRDGLLALKDGLTTAGAGLTRLGAFVQADEYGVVAIASGASETPIPGCFYETGNIPDNLQGAIVTGTCIVPGSVGTGDALHVLAGIRSNESDGVVGPPAVDAGVAGIVALKQTTTQFTGPTPGAASNAYFGATTPNAALGGAPALSIPLKSAPTSTTETSFPFALISTDKTVDLIANSFTGQPTAPVFPAIGMGIVRTVEFTVRFSDLSTNAAADPTS